MTMGRAPCAPFCGLPMATTLLRASTSDNSICIHSVGSPSNMLSFLRNHREGVTALALSPNSTCLASGSLDHSVKLYKFPGLLTWPKTRVDSTHCAIPSPAAVSTNRNRNGVDLLEMPIETIFAHSLAKQACGRTCFFILLKCQIAKQFDLQNLPISGFAVSVGSIHIAIRAVAFNKSGTILAAAGDDEGIKLVNTIDGTIARVLKGHKGSVTSLSFDPKSEYLASLDSDGTVIYWELQSGSTVHVLKAISPKNGGDMSALNILAWSPDGEMLAVPGLKNDVYMATSGLDKQILIWDVDKKQDIERQKFSECISGMAWKPHGNALAVIDFMGKYGVWESAVPLTMKSPTENIPGLHSKNGNGFVLFDEEEEPAVSGNLSDFHEDSHGEFEPPSRKRLRKHSNYDDDWEEDCNDELESIPKVESRKKASYGHKGNLNGKSGSRNMIVTAGSKMQEAFQPGATPAQPGKRHFLCYNMLGSITTMEHDGYSHIEIDFHDTSSGPRVPAMTDYFGFTMASLNENGSVFANPCKGEKNMSTLMYRPFSSWANNSEWSMRFEGEEVRAIALGNAWVAAVTSLNFLRIFSEGGLQRYILSLDGPVVTAAGYKDELAVVTHSSPSLPTDEQMLEFRVFNIAHGTQPLRGRLPLTPGSCLTWLGFSEEGHLSSFDSKGVLRVFTSQYGGSWLPLFSASKLKKPDENYWVAGLSASKLFCIVCKSPESFPQSTPKPVLTLLDLSFLLLVLTWVQRSIEERAASGHDTTSLDDEAFNLETSLDRCILRLIASCCNGDKLVRASELVKLLSLEKSVRGAIKLVTALKLPNLAERFSSILEEKLLSETSGNTVLPVRKSNSKKSEGIVPSPAHTLPSTSSASKRDDEEPCKDRDGNSKQGQSTTLGKATDVKTAVKLKADQVHSLGETKAVKVDQRHFSRPSNPFAKSASNQESSSLFDSLKKMKKGDMKDK
ncbi:hypothetical protein Salat_1461000 [Sesamum alatum]|uniref:Minichromosome loss protein Mcl1 middle region domain-containing protein n=1 Tax=Sesamum alatum TaxID=300844 RepID=A0AAE1YB78_9LAMI|nr:hypothetical protein Salat_1461000 [Sesamum alatum]